MIHGLELRPPPRCCPCCRPSPSAAVAVLPGLDPLAAAGEAGGPSSRRQRITPSLDRYCCATASPALAIYVGIACYRLGARLGPGAGGGGVLTPTHRLAKPGWGVGCRPVAIPAVLAGAAPITELLWGLAVCAAGVKPAVAVVAISPSPMPPWWPRVSERPADACHRPLQAAAQRTAPRRRRLLTPWDRPCCRGLSATRLSPELRLGASATLLRGFRLVGLGHGIALRLQVVCNFTSSGTALWLAAGG